MKSSEILGNLTAYALSPETIALILTLNIITFKMNEG